MLYLDDRNLRHYSYSSASSHLPFLFLSSSPSPPPLFLFLSSAPLRGASTRCIPGASQRNLRCTQCFSPVPKTPVPPGCLSTMSSLPLLVASLLFSMFFPNACHDSFSPARSFPQPPALLLSVLSVCPQCLSPVPFLPVFPKCLIIVFTPSPRCLASVFLFAVSRKRPQCPARSS